MVANRRALDARNRGASPRSATNCGVAKKVRHLTVNQTIAGSIPAATAIMGLV